MSRRRKPRAPGPNRAVPIFDRRADGMTAPGAAWRTVDAMLLPRPPRGHVRRPPRPWEGARKELPGVAAILATLDAGLPVVMSGVFPAGLPDLDGHFPSNGKGEPMTVAILNYNAKRDAVRLTPSLGLTWGQLGRAWLPVTALRAIMRDGGRAWAPNPGTK